MPKTFSHSGAAGDLIYALPTMRALGGGALYMNPSWGPWCDAKMVDALRPLLLEQPYILEVKFERRSCDFNLDQWRSHYRHGFNIAEMCLMAFNILPIEVNKPWLRVSNPQRKAKVVIHRSPRYHNENFPWRKVLEKYKDEMAIVGFGFECDYFCRQFGRIPYIETPDYLSLTEVIAGSVLFIGNQSSPYAVAEGLKHNSIQEVCEYTPNCLFDRRNAGYGIDETLFLPELP